MKVKFGAIVTDGRGKINGAVFQGNNGSVSMRTHAVPIRSAFHLSNYSFKKFAYLSQEWRNLSESQRKGFSIYAKNICCDLDHKPSGFELFMSANSFYASIGYIALLRSVNNLTIAVPPITSVVFSATLNYLNIYFIPWLPVFYIVRIKVSKPCRDKSQANTASLKVVSAIYSNSASPINIISSYRLRITPSTYTGQFVRFLFESYQGGNPFAMPAHEVIVQIT